MLRSTHSVGHPRTLVSPSTPGTLILRSIYNHQEFCLVFPGILEVMLYTRVEVKRITCFQLVDVVSYNNFYLAGQHIGELFPLVMIANTLMIGHWVDGYQKRF